MDARLALVSGLAVFLASSALARDLRITVEHGYEFVTIDAPGNRGYEGFGHFQWGEGWGAVDYTYRMARSEVGTGEWLEFVNSASRLSSNPFLWMTPSQWGGMFTAPGSAQLRPDIEHAARIPVRGLNFLQFAMYCNWLHNDKQVTTDALLTGAYDLAGDGYTVDSPRLTSLIEREPDARFWIPSLDEWTKAVYFDPDAEDEDFPGEGRYWLNPYGSDEVPTPGYPGEEGAQTSGGINYAPPPGEPFTQWIPLGAYPDSQTPWGLLDASGGASELTSRYEGTRFWTKGLYTGQSPSSNADLVYGASAGGSFGLRLASAIPAPATAPILLIALSAPPRRRR